MRFPISRPRQMFSRKTAKNDAMAGLVLGIESVPDGLANGLLAGVNPVAGLYGYLYGMVGGALFTSTTVMAVQGTGAMAIIVADVDLNSRDDPLRSLYTLTILAGLVMIIAGLLKLGSFLRFVSNSVMTGFITAVGLNIVLGQLDNFTGYDAEGPNRIVRALNLLVNLNEIDLPTLIVGVVSVALIIWLQRTRLGSLGLVVAVFAGSAVAALFRVFDRDIAQVRDVAEVPRSLPFAELPLLGEIPSLLVPALSLAFVGLVQGAGVSAGFASRQAAPTDTSQDFVGQGAGNVVAGFFQGMPVGGSMSATSLVVSAGARTRAALLYGGLVMAVMIVVFAPVVERVAMPSLAALLIVVGFGTVKPAKVKSIARTGPVPLTVMSITLVLTMIIPLQYAVIVGVGLSVLLFVIRQSSRLTTRQMLIGDDGRIEEVAPPDALPANTVVALQPYGAIFFATAATLVDQMPEVTPTSRNSVVILRVRGLDEAGVTFLDVLRGYAQSLNNVQSKLMVVTDNEHVLRQIEETGAGAIIGHDNVYQGTTFIGEAVRAAHHDAHEWVGANMFDDDTSSGAAS
jgi:SulP family sulfate permease